MIQGLWKSVRELENRNGILHFGGCDTRELAEQFGTPLYVYSEDRIIQNYQRLLNAYQKRYQRFKVFYAVKANNNPAIVQRLGKEGVGADASCVPEIKIAQMVGIPNDRILYSAVYPSEKDIKFALDAGVKINIEDISQLEVLKRLGVPEFLCMRVNPGIGSSGIKGLIFAGPGAKFGIPEKDIEEAYKKAKEMGVKRFGIHMMTGSNILNPDYFGSIVERLLDIAGPIGQKLGIQFDFIDLGGSLGIPYKPEEQEIDIEAVATIVTTRLKEKLHQYKMGEPVIVHEPGRYLMGDAGLLLSKVVAIKQSEQTFIGLDAGMHTLLRPALHDAYHHIWLANDLDAPCDAHVNLVGQICESTDTFARNRQMPSKIKVHDLLAFSNTGAYGFCMSSNYNSQPKAAEVMISKGEARLIRKRETYEDIIRGVSISPSR